MTPARVIPFPARRPLLPRDACLRDFESALVDLVQEDRPVADHDQVIALVARAIDWIDAEDVPLDEGLLLVEGLVRHVIDGSLECTPPRPALRLVVCD